MALFYMHFQNLPIVYIFFKLICYLQNQLTVCILRGHVSDTLITCFVHIVFISSLSYTDPVVFCTDIFHLSQHKGCLKSHLGLLQDSVLKITRWLEQKKMSLLQSPLIREELFVRIAK